MLLSIILLAATIQPDSGVVVLEPRLSYREFNSEEVAQIPRHHYDLMMNARQIEKIGREKYFAMLDDYIAEAGQCENTFKLGWMIELAHRTHGVAPVQERLVPPLHDLILEQPACFVEAFNSMQFGLSENIVLRQLVFTKENELLEDHRQALSALLEDPVHGREFSEFAAAFRTAGEQYNDAMERERERERLRKAQAEREYRAMLFNTTILSEGPGTYWRRWADIAASARDCEEPADAAAIFQAALLHQDDARYRQNDAEFIEALALDKPACALAGISAMDDREEFSKTFIFQPHFHAADAIAVALLGAQVDGEVEKTRERLRRDWSHFKRRNAGPIPHTDKFIWSAQQVESDDEGTLYVSPFAQGDMTPYMDRVRELWESTPASERRGSFDRVYKTLPIEAMDFITDGNNGYFQVLNIGNDDVRAVNAKVVGAALVDWYCEGPVPLLQLEIENRPEWLPDREAYLDYIAIRSSRPLPLPETENVSTDERLFTSGTLHWPGTGRSMNFRFTSAYTSIQFNGEDRQTGEGFYGRRAAWDCH